MNDKERLVELIGEVLLWKDVTIDNVCKQVAAHLIANGVTVQKQGQWRKEGKTVDGNLVLVCPFCLHDRVQQHFKEVDHYCPHCGAELNIK